MLTISRRTRLQNREYLVMIIPALLAYSLFVLWPVLSNLYFSFTNWNGLNRTYRFIFMDNYKNIFRDQALIKSIGNTLYYALFVTILQNVLAIPLAVVLDRKIKGKHILRMMFFLPAVFSPLIVGFLWSYIMSPKTGLLFLISQKMGMGSLNWLGNPNLVMTSVSLVSVWQWTGWAMVIYLANLQAIPRELYEAAEVDGAGFLSKFRNIILPLLAPAVTINILNSMIGSLKVFDIIMSMTQGGPGYASETITTILIKRSFTEGRLGYGSSIAVVFFTLIFLISLVLLKYLSNREKELS